MSNKTLIKGIEQGRAKKAYEFVECAIETLGEKKDASTDSKGSKDYRQYIKKIPMLIKTNGLGAALAFIHSRKGKDQAYKLIYTQFEDWLREDPKQLIELKDDDLVKVVISLDSNSYRAVNIELLALLNWMRRFADGLIKGE